MRIQLYLMLPLDLLDFGTVKADTTRPKIYIDVFQKEERLYFAKSTQTRSQA